MGEMMVNHGLLGCPIFGQTPFAKMNVAQATSAPAVVLKDGSDGYGHCSSTHFLETLLEDLLEFRVVHSWLVYNGKSYYKWMI